MNVIRKEIELADGRVIEIETGSRLRCREDGWHYVIGHGDSSYRS